LDNKIIGQATDGLNQGAQRERFSRTESLAKAHQLTLAVYQITAPSPREQLYGLTSQLRRSASSIPANLAEDADAMAMPRFARFCSIALESASELEYHLLLARDLKLIQPRDYEELAGQATELKRMLTALFQKLNADR